MGAELLGVLKSGGITLNFSHFYVVVSEQRQYAGFVRLRACDVENASRDKLVIAWAKSEKKCHNS